MGHNHIVQLLSVRVTPDDDPNGFGILVDGSVSLPFTLERAYSGVQGYYFEQYLIMSGDKTVFASEPQQIFIRGLQSSTLHKTRVDERIPLSAGTCDLVFVVDDIRSEPIELTVNAVASV
jgi:hypothetical protein